jgi:hypothetical protein
MDANAQQDREAIRSRYAATVRDAFFSQEAPAEERHGRLRGSASNADAVRQHALRILDKGPDSILMEWPQGTVPRQG